MALVRCLAVGSARVEYDDAEHAYLLDGQRVPAVTQILTLTGRIDTRWFTEAACERGRRVHAWAEQIDTQCMRSLPDEATGGYVEAYLAMLRDCRPIYDTLERAYWHPQLRYGGRPDRGIRRWALSDGPATLELKTGNEEDWHGVQLAGYERLRRRGSRWVCYLQANGRYKIRPCENSDDHAEFLRALQETWAAWPTASAAALPV